MTSVGAFSKYKRGGNKHLHGTRPSIHNSQVLISTGIPSLDTNIGGGVALGTVLLIEEDTYDTYSAVMTRYFMAEGAVSKHSLFIADMEPNTGNQLHTLPAVIEEESADDDVGPAQNMQIAWRYEHQPNDRGKQRGGQKQLGHFYDLSKTMPRHITDNVHCTSWNGLTNTTPDGSFSSSVYMDLLRSLSSHLEQEQFLCSSPGGGTRLLRIVVRGVGGAVWGDDADMWSADTQSSKHLTMFLYKLRALLRSAFAAAVVTMPTHLFQDSSLVSRCRNLCDVCVELEGFNDPTKSSSPLYADYHGLFHLHKLSNVNSLKAFTPQTRELAFKLKKKKFSIEKLHLPPELGETVSRSQEDPVKPRAAAATGCPQHLQF